jgi:hypothetical protein
MPLPLPNLDDRTFDELVEETRRIIQQNCPEWTDLTPNNPGMVILEVFAHLTETMLYRLNRLPEKAYIAFLRLIGVRIHPPAAAGANLRFSRSRAIDRPTEIPRGTRVATSRQEGGGEPATFVTAQTTSIPAGETSVEVLAHHCELIEGELAGVGTGLPGLTVEVQRPPIVAPTGNELDLLVGVEAAPEEGDQQGREEERPIIQHQGQVYRVWREVETFANLGTDQFVYVADRMSGRIIFAPAARMKKPDEEPEAELESAPHALAEIPPAGREIRLWYRRGGGLAGNVAANALTVLKDSIQGVEVTNPEPATGGQEAESVENALTRGPQELHSLHRAVTARDFELVALSGSRAVLRSRALTHADLWSYANPGTVEVLLVPRLPEEERSGVQVTASALQEWETEVARNQIQDALDERRPLGTTCVVNWTRYKTVWVTARIVVRGHEDRLAIRQRVLERLYQTINPLPTQHNPNGWPFGQALRASHVYDIALAEPGVLWVDKVELHVDDVPNEKVRSITSDPFQPHTWYAGSGSRLFRSLDDGDGWEPSSLFEGEQVAVVRAHPQQAGIVVAVTQVPNEESSRIHVSRNCGESWQAFTTTSFEVNDIAWILRESTPVLLLATESGLYELVLTAEGSPVQVLVSQDDPDLGFYAVAASQDLRGQITVGVAARGTEGIFLSSEGGETKTFRHIGLDGEDIRALAVQRDGPRSFLWAGAAAAGGADGEGCFRWELRGSENPPEGWQSFGEGWKGGTCRSLAFLDNLVVAGSHHAGVQWLDTSAQEPSWSVPDVNCGLPLRDPGRFHPVDTVAVGARETRIMAGGVAGVYVSRDKGKSYTSCSSRVFSDKVTLPPTWLFCSGDHDITVETEDEAERD